MKTKTMMLILCTVLLSCKKDNNILLNGNLIGCPINTTCSYNYYDNADFTNVSLPAAGNFRVFSYKTVNANLCGATSELYFKTKLSNSEFEINANQIAAGDIVAYNQVCPCCDNASLFKPIGGDIKAKRTDATHWLINASIVFGTTVNLINHPIDTLRVNQYFTLTKLP